MAIQYAGGTTVNATFTGDSKANIITAIQTHLTTAGWSVVSGGGSTNLLMQTATTPSGLKMRYRFKDNGNTCVQVTIENVGDLFAAVAGGSDSNNGIHLLPATSEIWRIIANKYQFSVFSLGPTSTSRKFACGGVPYIPSFLDGVITEAGHLHGNSSHSTVTTNCTSFRISCGVTIYNDAANQQHVLNGSLYDRANDTNAGDANRQSGLHTVFPRASSVGWGYLHGWRWHNLDLMTGDVLLAWPAYYAGSGTFVEARVRGQMWDAIWIGDAFAGGTTTSFDSHSWYCLTDNAGQSDGGGSSQETRGGIWVVIP